MRPSQQPDAEVASMWKLAPMEDWDTVKVGCIGLLFCYVKKLSILMCLQKTPPKKKKVASKALTTQARESVDLTFNFEEVDTDTVDHMPTIAQPEFIKSCQDAEDDAEEDARPDPPRLHGRLRPARAAAHQRQVKLDSPTAKQVQLDSRRVPVYAQTSGDRFAIAYYEQALSEVFDDLLFDTKRQIVNSQRVFSFAEKENFSRTCWRFV